jgi:hypothetical protein
VQGQYFKKLKVFFFFLKKAILRMKLKNQKQKTQKTKKPACDKYVVSFNDIYAAEYFKSISKP